MTRSPRGRKLDQLTEDGYCAALAGKPCDAPTTRELERAAWENGWRSGKALQEETETDEV